MAHIITVNSANLSAASLIICPQVLESSKSIVSKIFDAKMSSKLCQCMRFQNAQVPQIRDCFAVSKSMAI